LLKDRLRDIRPNPNCTSSQLKRFPQVTCLPKNIGNVSTTRTEVVRTKRTLAQWVSTVARLCVDVVLPRTQPDTCFSVHYSHKRVQYTMSDLTDNNNTVAETTVEFWMNYVKSRHESSIRKSKKLKPINSYLRYWTIDMLYCDGVLVINIETKDLSMLYVSAETSQKKLKKRPREIHVWNFRSFLIIIILWLCTHGK